MTTNDTDQIRRVRARLLARRAELLGCQERAQAVPGREREPLSPYRDGAAVVSRNAEVLRVIGAKAIEEVRQIDLALERADVGALGICERCGREISASRLDIVPLTSFCLHCEQTS